MGGSRNTACVLGMLLAAIVSSLDSGRVSGPFFLSLT
jgi:hypothetical protein